MINFLVYYSKKISFIKSVDALGFATDVKILCNLFSNIIEIVGPQNAMHIVTDNGANNKVGRRLQRSILIYVGFHVVLIA